MEFGVAFPSKVGDYEIVKLAESLGFDQAWFFDSQMIYSDVYATMALAAHHTSHIKLATGVAVAATRIAPVIAHSIATIAQLAPGRVELGLGNGNTARLTMGVQPVKLPVLKREIRTIKALLQGKRTLHEYENEKNYIEFLHPDNNFINLKHRIPITLSAFGPQTLKFCGEECDSHLTWNISKQELTSARALLTKAAQEKGRGSELPTKGIFPLAILKDGETKESASVLKSLAPFITNLLHVLCEWDDKLLPEDPRIASLAREYREYVDTIDKTERHLVLHEGHLIYSRPEESKFITPEIADVAAMVGSPDEILERIKNLESAGLSHFAFQVTDRAEEQIKDFAKTIIEKY
ncbi:MAG: LLM class flavin-dependent oxidoreductase [Pseudomonadota bacterium]|nr:LLM class flavin-dependent oxidoreductase [Pseudomonadota bacterium]